MAQKDYYDLLEVERDADAKTIKRAFLKKARALHPDVNKDADAEERFKEVNEAYAVLSDDRKRANYDRFGTAEGPSGFGSDYVDMSDIFGGGFGDIFSSFFGGAAASGGRPVRTRGRDMGINLQVSLAEAAAGVTKTISYERLAPCDDCGGLGIADGGHEKTCDRCHGTGRVVEVQRTIFGQMQTETTCPECQGTGKVIDHPCETCGGQGRTPSRETVDIEIPAGVYSGQAIRVEAKGEAGVRGDSAGDLVVAIEVLEDERFERNGDDLYCELSVDALEAMVGTKREIDGILEDETVRISVPAAVQFGQHVLVKGHGMPRRVGKGRGNLIAVVRVVVPDNLTAQQKRTVREVVAQRTTKAQPRVKKNTSSRSKART